jgi:putative acetyltransferase
MTGPAGGVYSVSPDRPEDAHAIRSLLRGAFETSAEADLVDRLRHDGDLVLGMVARDITKEILGYAGFVRLRIEHAGQEFPAVGLAPLAVAERYRRQGIGTDLVDGGLRNLAVRREALVFVLGNPAYYTRFGFKTETAKPFTCVYAGPHFMAMQFADNVPSTGVVRYPAAFEGLS